jgi:hypothetical protein
MFPPSTSGLGAARDGLRAFVSGLDAAAVPLESVDTELEAAAEVERLAGAAKLLLAARAAEVDRKGTRFRNAAEYLASVSGCTQGAAAGVVQTAKRLLRLPVLTGAVRRGEVSVEQARVVADAAVVAPTEEASLVDTARHDTLKRLREAAQRAKASADPRSDEERAAEIRRTRRLSTWTDAQGAGEGAFRGPVEDLAEIDAALSAHQERLFAKARAEGSREPYAAYRWDALLSVARASLRDGDAGKPVARKILVRADQAALARGSAAPGETVDLPGYGPIAVSVAKKLAEDATWHALLTKGTDVVAATNAQRKALSVQRVALEWESPTCTTEGCDNARFLEIDHITGWATTHDTQIGDLQRPCHRCHDLKTRHGHTLEDQGPDRRKRLIPPPRGTPQSERSREPHVAA